MQRQKMSQAVSIALCLLLMLGLMFFVTMPKSTADDLDSDFILLPANTTGRLLDKKILAGGSLYALHVVLDEGSQVWIYYRLHRAKRPSLVFFDEQGHLTADIGRSTSLMTSRNGVTAWNSDWQEEGQFEFFEAQQGEATPNLIPRPAEAPAINVADALWSEDCEDFIDGSGTYGSWGRSLHSLFMANPYAYIFNGRIGDIREICPRFDSFDSEKKAYFATYFIAAVSMEESGCHPAAHRRGPNGIAAGLMQLDLGRTIRYCGGICGSINAYDPAANVLCGSKMLNWYTESVANVNHDVYWSGNYWETLHPGAASQVRVNRLVHLFETCFN